MKLWVFLLVMPVALACVSPGDGALFDSSVDLCTDVFYLDHGIFVSGSNIVVNCNGAVLKSWSGGRGITITDSANVTVIGCRLVNYDVGFFVENSSKVFLNDNHLVKNDVGVRLEGVSDSSTFNHDVSLSRPFEVFESSNNVLSLTNKVVSGGFCSLNFCNERRDAVFLFAAPESTVEEMVSWLFGKTAARLRSWVFSDFI
ncbi:hypothetical protein KY309_02525 [Candidatus Woesearchaeota archaeon]|nr:hypothetical protein [Candidatus Woesearchaeota archaeon]MBW3016461.1 hypothetical protein [Candidatus Woesearchaeota archaeon]